MVTEDEPDLSFRGRRLSSYDAVLPRIGASVTYFGTAVVRQFEWPAGRVHVFAHGERESMKALRPVLFVERELERAQVSLSGYWAYGRTEDRFQAEKREPIGKIL